MSLRGTASPMDHSGKCVGSACVMSASGGAGLGLQQSAAAAWAWRKRAARTAPGRLARASRPSSRAQHAGAAGRARRRRRGGKKRAKLKLILWFCVAVVVESQLPGVQSWPRYHRKERTPLIATRFVASTGAARCTVTTAPFLLCRTGELPYERRALRWGRIDGVDDEWRC